MNVKKKNLDVYIISTRFHFHLQFQKSFPKLLAKCACHCMKTWRPDDTYQQQSVRFVPENWSHRENNYQHSFYDDFTLLLLASLSFTFSPRRQRHND